jgi:hypothetical protein
LFPNKPICFVDGKAINDGNHTISLSAGKHTVVVVNYGYKLSSQDVNIEAGKTTPIEVTLTPYGDKVGGPWGRIQLKGPGRAAVLLEGKTPDYFVGHVDEFNWDWIWKQELLVPPGHAQHHRDPQWHRCMVWDGKRRGEPEGRHLS